jgi:ribonuclease VapC
MKRPGVIRHILDSSAILAMLYLEPGADTVAAVLSHAVLSSVNLTEVVGKLTRRGLPLSEAVRLVRVLQLRVMPFDERQAMAAAALQNPTAPLGLSLGDRACLALAQRMSLPIVTADRAWAKLDLGIEVKLIR